MTHFKLPLVVQSVSLYITVIDYDRVGGNEPIGEGNMLIRASNEGS